MFGGQKDNREGGFWLEGNTQLGDLPRLKVVQLGVISLAIGSITVLSVVKERCNGRLGHFS